MLLLSNSKQSCLNIDSTRGWLLAPADTRQIHSDRVCWRTVWLCEQGCCRWKPSTHCGTDRRLHASSCWSGATGKFTHSV